MKNYVLLFRGGMDYRTASPDDLQADVQLWHTWMGALAAQGKMVPGGQQLVPAGAAVTGSAKHVTDGPFAEGKELIGGFIVVAAADMTEAIDIAKGCPILLHDGSAEVREVAAA